MATYTPNLNLEKPLQTELYNVDVFNANADKIDAGVGARAKYTDALTLEEIIASTDLTNKVASASAAKSLKESLSSFKCLATEQVTISTTATTRTLPASTVCMVLLVSGDNSVVSGLWFFRIGTASLQMFEIKKGSETVISTNGLTFSLTKTTGSRTSTIVIYRLSDLI